MGRRREYSDGTLAALYSLAQGTCYWPDPPCQVPIVVMIDGVPELNVDKAHIYAANPGGARENEEMTPVDLDDFPNLILLCRPHHRRIDGRRRDLYPPELLKAWKVQREGPGLTILGGLGRLTEERLREIFIEAHESITDRMHEAVERFAATDAEAAALLQVLIDELAEARLHALGLDPDLITMLSSSSDQLMSLADYAPMLAVAAQELRELPDAVPGLVEASQRLGNLGDDAGGLWDAWRALSNALENFSHLNTRLEELLERWRWQQGDM